MGDISQQLVDHVNAARETNTKLNIVGRGTKTFLGRIPVGESIDVAGHDGIVDYQPVELVITVRAGTSLADIVTALDEHGQMLSFEPPTFGGKASIGGTLAANLSGPARPWSGAVRDLLLGIRLINGKGEYLRFGGQVMKNVAGYDVSRLQAGAMGTLGIITELSLKVMPKPAATVTLVQNMDCDEAIETMNRLAGQHSALSGACWLENKLNIRFSGTASAVKQASSKCNGDVLESGNDFWQELRDMKLRFFDHANTLWRFSVKSSAGNFRPDARWLIDWGGALRWLCIAADERDVDRNILEQAAVAANGQAMLFRGGDRSQEVFHSQSKTAMCIHRRLKSAFDPDGLLNPGRLYSWM